MLLTFLLLETHLKRKINQFADFSREIEMDIGQTVLNHCVFREFLRVLDFCNFSREIEMDISQTALNHCVFANFYVFWIFVIFLVKLKLRSAKQNRTITFSRIFLYIIDTSKSIFTLFSPFGNWFIAIAIIKEKLKGWIFLLQEFVDILPNFWISLDTFSQNKQSFIGLIVLKQIN